MVYLIVFIVIVFTFSGIFFIIKEKKVKTVKINIPEVNKNVNHLIIGLETIKGTSYFEEKQQNSIDTEINAEQEIEEISDHNFQVEGDDDDDYDDGELYNEDDEIINQKLDAAANILKEIDIANKEYVEEIESMIFDQVLKNERSGIVEKVLEKKVVSFIDDTSENNYEKYKQELINK